MIKKKKLQSSWQYGEIKRVIFKHELIKFTKILPTPKPHSWKAIKYEFASKVDKWCVLNITECPTLGWPDSWNNTNDIVLSYICVAPHHCQISFIVAFFCCLKPLTTHRLFVFLNASHLCPLFMTLCDYINQWA